MFHSNTSKISNLKIGKNEAPGPGAYDLYENSKKTFNMAKELGKPEVWL